MPFFLYKNDLVVFCSENILHTVFGCRMMVEEEQISFRSDSIMVDGVEDYSHQIAEMIGLRNESNFNEAGVSVFSIIITYSIDSRLNFKFHAADQNCSGYRMRFW